MPEDLRRQLPAQVERELGHGSAHSSTDVYLDDSSEEAPELRWPNSVQVYERMRRTDAQCRAVERQVTLPIRRVPFGLRENGAPEEAVERLSRNLGLPIEGRDSEDQPLVPRRRGRFSFSEHLRLALLKLPFGHMVFNQVARQAEDGSGFYDIHKLSPRMPSSLDGFKVAKDGGLIAAVQNPHPDDPATDPVEIPVANLVVYVNDREGGNWYGQSIYRPAYKHWMLKDRLYRVESLILERGAGVPFYEASPQGGEDELARGEKIAKKYRIGEGAGGSVPNGAKIVLAGISGTIPDPGPAINRHDIAIARNVLAQFMMLGGQDTAGHRALGETFLENFYLGLQAAVDQFVQTFNQHVIEDWMDWNYSPDTQAPLLVAPDVTEYVIASDVEGLINAGAITPDGALERHLRRIRRLPPPDATTVPRPNPEPPPVGARAQARRDALVRAGRARRVRAADGQTFRRALFAHELQAATDFAGLQAQYVERLDALIGEWENVRADQVDELLDQVQELVDEGDLAGLADISASTGPGADLLADALAEVADEAAADAIVEAKRQGATIPDPDLNDAAVRLRARAEAVDGLLAKSLAETAGRQALNRAGALTGAEVAAAVRAHLDGLSDTWLRDQLGGAVTSAQGEGRAAVIGAGPPARIYASELLDENTCETCADVDGREYSSLQEAEADYPTGGYAECLGGPRCRGTLVAVYEEASPSAA